MQILFDPASPGDEDAAQQLALRTGLEAHAVLAAQQRDNAEPALVRVAGRWELQSAAGQHRLRVDFCSSRWQQRLRPANLNGEYLVRALRGRKRDLQGSTVLDATAGFGSDSLLLAAAGFEVTLLERMPVLVCLLEQAIAEAAVASDEALRATVNRMTPLHVDSIDYMRALQSPPDFVYLDPMYDAPPVAGQVLGKKRSAAPRKEMAVLKQLTDPAACDPAEAGSLLEHALAVARSKVVVKRPLHAPALAGIAPTSTLAGSAARFDIYAL